MRKNGIILLLVLIVSGVVLILVLNQKPANVPNPPQPAPLSAEIPSQTAAAPTATEIPVTVTAPTGMVEATQLPLPPADEAAKRLTVSDGFAIRIFADNISGTPRFMTVGEDGQVYVSLYAGGEIARLPDRDDDGLADGIEIVAGGLTARMDWSGTMAGSTLPSPAG